MLKLLVGLHLLLFFTHHLHAAQMKYQLIGTYELNSKEVKYVITWPQGEKVDGIYDDDQGRTEKVYGISSREGRKIRVDFPGEQKLEQLTFSFMPVKGAQTVSVPVIIELQTDDERSLLLKERAHFRGVPYGLDSALSIDEVKFEGQPDTF